MGSRDRSKYQETYCLGDFSEGVVLTGGIFGIGSGDGFIGFVLISGIFGDVIRWVF